MPVLDPIRFAGNHEASLHVCLTQTEKISDGVAMKGPDSALLDNREEVLNGKRESEGLIRHHTCTQSHIVRPEVTERLGL